MGFASFVIRSRTHFFIDDFENNVGNPHNDNENQYIRKFHLHRRNRYLIFRWLLANPHIALTKKPGSLFSGATRLPMQSLAAPAIRLRRTPSFPSPPSRRVWLYLDFFYAVLNIDKSKLDARVDRFKKNT